MLIDFIKKETYDYTQEIDGDIYIHPLFYATYSFVRKRLIEEFGMTQRLETIDPDKAHYSVKMDLIPGQFTSSSSFRRRTDEYQNALEEVEISKFFLELLDILPSAHHYNLYVEYEGSRNTDFFLEAPIGGKELRSIIDNDTIGSPRERLEYSYQREMNLYEYRFFVDYSYMLLALGNLYLSNISYKELVSVDDYLAVLNLIASSSIENFRGIDISNDFLSSTLKRATNEGRIAFFKKIKNSENNLIDLINKEIKDGAWSSKKFSKDSIMGNFDTLINPNGLFVQKDTEQVNLLRDLKDIYNITETKAQFQSTIQNLNYRSRERNNIFKREVAHNFNERIREEKL